MSEKKTICLCMMLKNESHIIKRSLESVKDIVDYYVISDTGSTDDTKKIVKDYFDEKGINGEIHDHEWINFGVNRTKLIKTAKGKADYLLLVDADYVINVHDYDFKNNLNADGYLIQWEGNLDYKNLKLINGHLNWRYRGPTHEYLECVDHVREPSKEIIRAITIKEHYDGSNRKNKFERDIKLLLKEIEGNTEDPDIPRYHFYIARSYEDLGDYKMALKYYQKRVEFGGWNEEVYYSMYKAGLCKIELGFNFGSICETLLKAYEYRPSRLEAIYELIKYCRMNKLPCVGYHFGHKLVYQKYPDKDILFIKKDIYDYKLKDEVSICAYYAGEYLESIQMCKELISSNKTPIDKKERIKNNMNFSISKLGGVSE